MTRYLKYTFNDSITKLRSVVREPDFSQTIFAILDCVRGIQQISCTEHKSSDNSSSHFRQCHQVS